MGIIDSYGDFHLLRPYWLAVIPFVLVLWWRVRHRENGRASHPAHIAPHLANALTVGDTKGRGFLPIDGMVIVVLITAMACAGPTWNRVPNPLMAETAPLAIVLKLSESMGANDVQPSRAERAKQKIVDIIANRSGGRTSLIAYAGTAHRVVPMTEDPEVLKPFVEGLAIDVMPKPGENATEALRVASDTFANEQVPGAILFMLDGLSADDLPAFAQYAATSQTRLVFWTVGNDAASLSNIEGLTDADVVPQTHDGTDVHSIEGYISSAYRAALAGDDRQRWDDRGWLLAIPAALLALLCFRRGWTTRWALLVAFGVILPAASPAKADGLADWFLSADQQGRLAYEDKDFTRAAGHFENLAWRGYALYRSGKYIEAAQVFAGLQGADASFAQGVALVKGRQYREGIRSFEKALQQDPDHAAAARNLKIAQDILEYLERTREQTDTGEGSEGADEVVFDKESEGGAEIAITEKVEAKIQSADQWMRTVDTSTAEYLKLRFAYDAANAAKSSGD